MVHQVSIPREDAKHFDLLHFSIEVAKESTSQALDGTTLHLLFLYSSVRKGQSKISSNSVHSFHKASKSLPRNPNNSHKPFCAAVEEPQLLPTEYETLKLAA